MNWLQLYWKNHGTKVLGFLTAVAAIGQVCMDDLMHVVPESARPFVHMAIMGLGAATVRRGFTNSSNQT